jgi:predicted DNA-binding transcriptional regulator YafY
MTKGDNQKLKLLYLKEILMRETDDQHSLTLPQIVKRLNDYGVNAERKTLYSDFEELRKYGVDIIGEQAQRSFYYHIGNRDFELPELKLLVDSVQSAKFMTDKKSKTLISKLEAMASKYEARKLHRQVVISGRVKTMNESIYFNVDKLHEAIGSGSQIRFKYFQWNVKKEMELRKGGAWYQVSPWALMWDDENYYLVAYDGEEKKIKHYRVDKMLKISLLAAKREGREEFQEFDMPRYNKSLFGMYGGEEVKITLEAENEFAGVLIDRFGKDIIIRQVDAEHFRTVVNVAVSNQFFGWIMSLGNGVKIVAPESVVEQMRQVIRLLNEMYKG